VSGFGHTPDPRIDVVVVAGSAGVVPVYREIFGRLDATLPASVVLAQHRRTGGDVLVDLLRQQTRLRVRRPSTGERLQPGSLYVCPADAQLVFARHRRLDLEPLEQGRTPTADRVMQSAAAVHGGAVLAVVLSGRLDDGAAGVRAVKAAGGRVIVQDPRTAAHASMPIAALATGCADACLPPRSIADAMGAFVGVPGAAALFATRPAPWAWDVPSQPVHAPAQRAG
jgi:two-component system, chemotaxis family, protein-glutamate methylesterase/glutaminase